MVDFFKKHFIMLLITCVLLVAIIIMFLYLGTNKKGKEYYIEIFQKNQNIFEDIFSNLMSLENEISIIKESGKIIAIQNGNRIEITDYILDEETKSNIERVIRDLGIRRITKSSTDIEYVYNSNKDSHSIAYATDKNSLNSYTDVQHLEGNWYYCYIFHE